MTALAVVAIASAGLHTLSILSLWCLSRHVELIHRWANSLEQLYREQSAIAHELEASVKNHRKILCDLAPRLMALEATGKPQQPQQTPSPN